MWCLLEWRWDQGGTPYPFKGVSSPAGRGRALSLKESPVGTKISSLISPTSGSALERAKRVVRDPGPWRNSSLGQHKALPSAVT